VRHLDPTAIPFGKLWVVGPLRLTVTAAQPGLIKITQGNGQSAAPGQPWPRSRWKWTLRRELRWRASRLTGPCLPPAPPIFRAASTQTDVNGRTSVTATFLGYRFGHRSNHSDVPRLPGGGRVRDFQRHGGSSRDLTGLQIVSGNNQTALENATFGLPLVVQVNASNGQAAANVNVQFSVTGPASLSSSSVPTDSNGRAQSRFRPPPRAGTVTVTATVSSFTQTFSLTVLPPAPILSRPATSIMAPISRPAPFRRAASPPSLLRDWRRVFRAS
jgi:hypothetical protein